MLHQKTNGEKKKLQLILTQYIGCQSGIYSSTTDTPSAHSRKLRNQTQKQNHCHNFRDIIKVLTSVSECFLFSVFIYLPKKKYLKVYCHVYVIQQYQTYYRCHVIQHVINLYFNRGLEDIQSIILRHFQKNSFQHGTDIDNNNAP